MTLQEAISILKIHQEWRLGADIVIIEPKELTEAIQTIINLIDPKLLEGTTPKAWDLFFQRKLQIKTENLFYKEGFDNIQYNEGLLNGFELGSKWVWDNFKLEIK